MIYNVGAPNINFTSQNAANINRDQCLKVTESKDTFVNKEKESTVAFKGLFGAIFGPGDISARKKQAIRESLREIDPEAYNNVTRFHTSDYNMQKTFHECSPETCARIISDKYRAKTKRRY